MTEEGERRLGLAKLFGMGFIQVFLVASNTVAIAQFQLLSNAVTALGISYIWTHNVKKVAFGAEADRWAYALGAMVGSLCGSYITHTLLT